MTRAVIKYAEGKGITLPNSQTVRAAVELKAKHIDAPTQEAVSRSLSHSQETVLRHYRANDKSSGHLAFETIQEIVRGRKQGDDDEQPRESGTRKKSRSFSEAQGDDEQPREFGTGRRVDHFRRRKREFWKSTSVPKSLIRFFLSRTKVYSF